MGISGFGHAARRVALVARAAVGPAVLVLLLALTAATPSMSSTPDAASVADAAPQCGAAAPTPEAASEDPAADTMAEVRTPRGEIRVVSFERGWAVYNGQAPGTFLRVCRA